MAQPVVVASVCSTLVFIHFDYYILGRTRTNIHIARFTPCRPRTNIPI